MKFPRLLLIVCLNLVTVSTAELKFTNLQCKELVENFGIFEKCQLKMIQRNVVALNIYYKLLMIPVSNVTFNLSLFKKGNGYQPFLYNTSVDFCKFSRNTKLYPYMKIFFDSLQNVSNLNHTCPYDHDIIIKDMVLKDYMFKNVPFLIGDYMLKLKVAAYNRWILTVKVYITLTLGFVRFTNIKCKELRPKFATVSKCQLKMVQRGVAALDIYVKLFQIPVTNVTVTSGLYKKANGFRPFLYNTTTNFCEFMKNKRKYPFFNIIVDMFNKDSNINHSCPYNHDIILRNVILKDSMFKHLPLPGGEYMINMTVYAYNDPKVVLTRYSWASLKLTNIKCEELDSKFAAFNECRLRLPKRNTVALYLYVKLFQLPVNNVSINLSLMKKANGYKPFLYNVSTDFCLFMKNKKQHPFLNFFLNLLVKASNINHTCPFNHDVIVRNLVFQESMFQILPLPSGDYMFKLKVAAYKDWKADLSVKLLSPVNSTSGYRLTESYSAD
ncbi:hypothetical protein FF38_03132 [Lucilia cuprina]|uniref:Uncharacterized protein n=1 Tax=Lucilia cuprina TaxID=7375 RepID=A0A0L0C5S3_LUCCU|nr:hypothetical protein FF38_03132 [Lucilia cuprina]